MNARDLPGGNGFVPIVLCSLRKIIPEDSLILSPSLQVKNRRRREFPIKKVATGRRHE